MILLTTSSGSSMYIGLKAFRHSLNHKTARIEITVEPAIWPMRAFLMVIRAGADPVESFMPSDGPGPDIDADTYIMMRPLTGQNHLLQELYAAPRYIKEAEWGELERVLRNTAGITPDSLRKEHPSLTRGDIRIIILDRLGFSFYEDR